MDVAKHLSRPGPVALVALALVGLTVAPSTAIAYAVHANDWWVAWESG
jgi:hypothetical protein